MNFQSPSRFFSFLFVLLAPISLQFHHVSGNPEEFYKTCGNTFSCGNITGIGYPFRGSNDPVYCGYPGLELRCDQSQNFTRIQIRNMTYRVLDINPTTQTMRVAREDVMESTCPTQLVNSTLDYGLFDYASSYINLTFLYGCPSFNIPGLNVLPSCGSNGGSSVYVLPGTDGLGSSSCKTGVVYPVVQTGTGGSVNGTDLDQVLKEGFVIRWKVDSSTCNECTGSNGRCGYYFDTNQTTCFCPNKPYIESVACSMANGASPNASPSGG